jgi:hypothetical protein
MASSKAIDLNLNPDERTLQQFGFIALVAFGLLAACAYYEAWMFSFGLGALRVPVAGALGGVAVLSGLFSAVAPKANKPLFLGLTIVTYPIGLVMSYVVLGILFFGVFAPIGALLRATGTDPMQRSLKSGEPSYWSEARARRSKESYFRQF